MLTAKERLLRCFRKQPIDKAPIATYDTIGSWMDDTTWENNQESYKNLMSVIKEKTECMYLYRPKFKQTPGFVSEAGNFTEVIKWDEEKSHYTKTVYHLKYKDLICVSRVDDGINCTWTLKHLLDDIDDIDRYLSMPYEPPELDMTDFFKDRKKLDNNGVMFFSLADPICLTASLFEMGTFLVHAVTEPGKIKYFLDAIHERQMHELRLILKNDVKDSVISICGPEFATPPYLSPEYFYDFVTCYLIRMCREIKDAGAIPMIHCHGKIAKVLDQFAMTEAEGLDPIEPPPDGDIEMAEVKKRYGSKFCLLGDIELRDLEHAERDRMDFLVRKAMDAAKKYSGFMLMPTACPLSAPLPAKLEENYIQMIESGIKYGKY